MVIDVRAKGATAETKVRDELRKLTGLKWERVPGSGALDEKHGLKGDLYVPNEKNLFAVEVKAYKDDHITSQLLTSVDPQIFKWWAQAVRQGVQVSKAPLLIFKHDRSKLFVAYEEVPTNCDYLFIQSKGTSLFISRLDDWVKNENPRFV